jgi:hypothetical protein
VFLEVQWLRIALPNKFIIPDDGQSPKPSNPKVPMRLRDLQPTSSGFSEMVPIHHTVWLHFPAKSNILGTSTLISRSYGLESKNGTGIKFFFVIPFYLQCIVLHSANCVKTYIVACRRVLSSAAL